MQELALCLFNATSVSNLEGGVLSMMVQRNRATTRGRATEDSSAAPFSCRTDVIASELC